MRYGYIGASENSAIYNCTGTVVHLLYVTKPCGSHSSCSHCHVRSQIRGGLLKLAASAARPLKSALPDSSLALRFTTSSISYILMRLHQHQYCITEYNVHLRKAFLGAVNVDLEQVMINYLVLGYLLRTMVVNALVMRQLLSAVCARSWLFCYCSVGVARRVARRTCADAAAAYCHASKVT